MLSRTFLFLICSAVTTASSAAIVSYDYTGALLGGGAATVTGTFGYDNAVVDALPGDSGEGLYTGAGFWTGAVNGGPQDGVTFNFSNFNVSVFNDDVDFGDVFSIESGTPGITSFLDLEDEDAMTFSDDSLPDFLAFDVFEIIDFHLGLELGDSSADYEFTSISAPTVVPVPPAIWLFGSALLGFVGWSRGKKAA